LLAESSAEDKKEASKRFYNKEILWIEVFILKIWQFPSLLAL
jgi:hypothetical protein